MPAAKPLASSEQEKRPWRDVERARVGWAELDRHRHRQTGLTGDRVARLDSGPPTVCCTTAEKTDKVWETAVFETGTILLVSCLRWGSD